MRTFALALLVSLGGLGCDEEQPYTVAVSVETDDGKPLQGVTVKFGDGVRGVTDDIGQLRRKVKGQEGSKLAVTVDAPTGFKVVGKPKNAVILRNLLGEGNKPLPIEFAIKLSPLTRTYAVLVRTEPAGIEGITVRAFGEIKATTNRAGVAMFLYKGTPGEQLTVKLDTAGKPQLKPQNPEHTFSLPSRPMAFVYKETFTVTVERKAKIRHIGPRRL